MYFTSGDVGRKLLLAVVLVGVGASLAPGLAQTVRPAPSPPVVNPPPPPPPPVVNPSTPNTVPNAPETPVSPGLPGNAPSSATVVPPYESGPGTGARTHHRAASEETTTGHRARYHHRRFTVYAGSYRLPLDYVGPYCYWAPEWDGYWHPVCTW
jgi:hypothetical protein